MLEGLQPYDEDRIDELCGDGVRLKLVKPCTRCRITATNQDSGEVEGERAAAHAAELSLRSAALHGVCFGQNAIVVEGVGATLARGQALQVRWKLSNRRGLTGPAATHETGSSQRGRET